MTTTSRSVATSIGMITTYEDCRALRGYELNGPHSRTTSLAFLVLTQANEFGVPQVIVAGPLEELELADELRLQPLAFRHLRFVSPWPQRPLLAFMNGTHKPLAISLTTHGIG
jgi:hypothetical protein